MIETPVTVIGAGGIGGWVALQVARIGCPRLTVYEPDTVEDHNLENQPYWSRHIGHPKINGLRGRLNDSASTHRKHGHPMKINLYQEFADRDTKFRGVVVVCVDTLDARREIFAAVKYNAAVKLLIEAGAGEYQGMIYALNPKDRDHVRWYEPTLSDDMAAVQQRMCVMPEVAPVFATIISRLITGFADAPRIMQPVQVPIDYGMLPVIQSSFVELRP